MPPSKDSLPSRRRPWGSVCIAAPLPPAAGRALDRAASAAGVCRGHTFIRWKWPLEFEAALSPKLPHIMLGQKRTVTIRDILPDRQSTAYSKRRRARKDWTVSDRQHDLHVLSASGKQHVPMSCSVENARESVRVLFHHRQTNEALRRTGTPKRPATIGQARERAEWTT